MGGEIMGVEKREGERDMGMMMESLFLLSFSLPSCLSLCVCGVWCVCAMRSNDGVGDVNEGGLKTQRQVSVRVCIKIH